MRWPHWKSFIMGVVAALLGVFIFMNDLGVRGGVTGDSPDGRFTLLALAPSSCPDAGGEYLIQLRDTKSGSVIREVKLSFARGEPTVSLRGGGGQVVWDSQSQYADLFAAEVPILRVWVPSEMSSQRQNEANSDELLDEDNAETEISP
jgi:hypothetical protein